MGEIILLNFDLVFRLKIAVERRHYLKKKKLKNFQTQNSQNETYNWNSERNQMKNENSFDIKSLPMHAYLTNCILTT